MLYAFFWVILRRLNFICRSFGTLCLFHLHRQVGATRTYLPMKMEQTDCSETMAYKIQTPGYHPKESIQHHLLVFSSRSCIFLRFFHMHITSYINLPIIFNSVVLLELIIVLNFQVLLDVCRADR